MEISAILRGLSFRQMDEKAYAQTLTEGDSVLLARESTNQFDPNAIKVTDPTGAYHIGYVAKEIAAELAPMMDEGRHFVCSIESNMMRQIMLLIKEVEGNAAEDFGSSDTPVRSE